MRAWAQGYYYGLFAVLFTLTSPVMGHDELSGHEKGSLESTAGHEEAEESGLKLSFELRPTWTPSREKFHSDNDLELEYRFSPGFALGYTQGFELRLYDGQSQQKNVDAQPCLGFLAAEFGDLWKSADSKTSFGYTARLNAPTEKENREAGMLTGLGNFFKLRHDFSPTLALTAIEAPLLHVYSRAGGERDGVSSANPRFENRLGIAAELSFFKRALKVRLPAVLQAVRFADFEKGAHHNDTWAAALWITPEVTYALTGSTTVGLAYAENFVKEESQTLNELDFTHSGTAQFIFQQAL